MSGRLRDDGWRHELGNYPLCFSLQTRYGDMDSNAHLNNVAIARLVEESRLRLHQKILAQGAPVNPGAAMIVHLAIDYLGEGRYPGDVESANGVVRCGRSSYVLAHGLWQNGRPFVLAHSVMVSVAAGQSRPAPIAELLRAKLLEIQIGASAG